jgi:hypothetical protein
VQQAVSLEATASAAGHFARCDSERSGPFLLEASASPASHFARGDSECNKVTPRAMYIQSATLPGEHTNLFSPLFKGGQRVTLLETTASHYARDDRERSEAFPSHYAGGNSRHREPFC